MAKVGLYFHITAMHVPDYKDTLKYNFFIYCFWIMKLSFNNIICAIILLFIFVFKNILHIRIQKKICVEKPSFFMYVYLLLFLRFKSTGFPHDVSILWGYSVWKIKGRKGISVFLQISLNYRIYNFTHSSCKRILHH